MGENGKPSPFLRKFLGSTRNVTLSWVVPFDRCLNVPSFGVNRHGLETLCSRLPMLGIHLGFKSKVLTYGLLLISSFWGDNNRVRRIVLVCKHWMYCTFMNISKNNVSKSVQNWKTRQTPSTYPSRNIFRICWHLRPNFFPNKTVMYSQLLIFFAKLWFEIRHRKYPFPSILPY